MISIDIKNRWEKIHAPFKQALALSDKSASKVGIPWPVLLWSILILTVLLTVLSFAMLWLGDKLNASGMVLTRFMARAQAPVTAQYFYNETARDQITVVMYDQEFLEKSGSSWPISYQDHADWLLRLASDPHARPKAIFLDITFGQHRNDPTLPALKKALCTIQNEFRVPVFLAAMPSPQDGKLKVRSGIGASATSGEPPCFTLVGVDYIPDQLDGLAWSYLLTRHHTDSGWKSGPAEDPSNQPSYRSAAMAIAQDAAHIDLGEETTTMSLMWGHNSSPQKDRPEFLKNCQPGEDDWRKVLPGTIRQIWEEPSQPICPYHRTLSMGQLSELSEQDVAPYLSGRYVMIGANVPGYNDFVDSPIHRLLPGIHLHAMALDNFLTYGKNYKQSAEWTLNPSPALFGSGLLSVLVVLFVHFVWSALLSKVKTDAPLEKCCCQEDSSTIGQRALKQLTNAFAWIAKITLQSVAAILLIATLQSFFRIGMLPVAELVGMTIVAEGLNLVKHLRELLYGKTPCSA